MVGVGEVAQALAQGPGTWPACWASVVARRRRPVACRSVRAILVAKGEPVMMPPYRQIIVALGLGAPGDDAGLYDVLEADVDQANQRSRPTGVGPGGGNRGKQSGAECRPADLGVLPPDVHASGKPRRGPPFPRR